MSDKDDIYTDTFTVVAKGVGRSSPWILDNLGVRISVDLAYKTYRAGLPWYRRLFWPWLTKEERRIALMSACLEQCKGG